MSDLIRKPADFLSSTFSHWSDPDRHHPSTLSCRERKFSPQIPCFPIQLSAPLPCLQADLTIDKQCPGPDDDTSVFSCPGMTIESGEGMTYFVPIIDGCPLHQSTFHMDIAGQDLTLYFLHLLSESGHSFVSTGGTLLFSARWTSLRALTASLASCTYSRRFVKQRLLSHHSSSEKQCCLCLGTFSALMMATRMMLKMRIWCDGGGHAGVMVMMLVVLMMMVVRVMVMVVRGCWRWRGWAKLYRALTLRKAPG